MAFGCNQLVNVVHGALKTYDVSDQTNPLDALGEPLKFEEPAETEPESRQEG